MKINFNTSFSIALEKQIKYISKDSVFYAKRFKEELLLKIKEIPKNPLIYRKSIYFEDENIRDLIFKGYTIVFRIDTDTVQVFGFIKQQNSL